MDYTPEERQMLNNDLYKLQKHRAEVSDEPFFTFYAGKLLTLLPKGCPSKQKLDKPEVCSILHDMAVKGHPILGRPEGSNQYWLQVGDQAVPKITLSGVDPAEFDQFCKTVEQTLNKTLTVAKLVKLYKAMQKHFQGGEG
jgi:hypothetical protein